MRSVAVIATAYLLGSIPFGYLIVRAAAGTDVRDTGSGGTGATNVTRRAGKAAGVLTLVLDAAKGAGAVAIASWLLKTDQVNAGVAASGIAAIIGHCFPIWLGFRGGKGVATGVGVFLMMAPLAVAGAGVIFVLIVWVTRYVSLGSILAAAAVPVLVALQHFLVRPVPGFQFVLVTALVGGLIIIIMHRANIGRLLSGTENKFK
jgi:acyl phosphate:glycerol-3-phosphate acyltransferase